MGKVITENEEKSECSSMTKLINVVRSYENGSDHSRGVYDPLRMGGLGDKRLGPSAQEGEASPSSVTAMSFDGLPSYNLDGTAIVLPQALLEPPEPKISSRRRKHRQNEGKSARTLKLEAEAKVQAAAIKMQATVRGHNARKDSSTREAAASTAFAARLRASRVRPQLFGASVLWPDSLAVFYHPLQRRVAAMFSAVSRLVPVRPQWSAMVRSGPHVPAHAGHPYNSWCCVPTLKCLVYAPVTRSPSCTLLRDGFTSCPQSSAAVRIRPPLFARASHAMPRLTHAVSGLSLGVSAAVPMRCRCSPPAE